MKRKMSSVIFIGTVLSLLAGCSTADSNNQEEKSAIPTMQIVYEEGYHLPQIPSDKEILTYKGESIDYFQWVEAAEKTLKLEDPVEIIEEEDYLGKEFPDKETLSVSKEAFFFSTQDYVNSADFLQLMPGDFYTGDIFSVNQEFQDFSKEEAYNQLKAFGDAVGYTFPSEYIVYAMDTEKMEKANQRFIELGDESAKGAVIAQGEFYRFYMQPQQNAMDILRKEDTYMGGSTSVDALVSKTGVEMISVYDIYEYTPDEKITIVDPEEAQTVIENKYKDIISDNAIYISDCSLCYYQEENPHSNNMVQLIPVYAFSLKTSRENPEIKVLVHASTGKEIIVE